MESLFTWDKIIKRFKSQESEDLTEFLFSNSKLLRLTHESAIIKVDDFAYSVLKDSSGIFYQKILNLLQESMSPNLTLSFVLSEDDVVEETIPAEKISEIPTAPLNNSTWNYEQTNLNPSFTFDNYFYSYDNQKIINSCKQVIHDIVNNSKQITFNPFFIYGSSGIGKTHIITALGNQIYQEKPDAKILYKNATEFLNDYTSLFKGGLNSTNELDSFKQLYFNLDVFIIDDIQMLRTKEGSLNEFFSIFEHMRNHNKFVIITSDVPPKELNFEERLLTRFLSGLVEPIQFPDSDTKTQIFRYHAHKIDLNIEEAAIRIFIDSSNSVRELLGYINSIKMEMLTFDANNHIYTETQAINNVNKATGNIRQMTAKEIANIICDYYEITESDLKSKSRKRDTVKARKFCIYFYRTKLKMTHKEIACDLHQKDHSNSVKTFNTFDSFKLKNEKDYNLLSQKINNKK